MKQDYAGRIKIMLKGFDDVFHTLIIAMERLEAYLEIEKRGLVPPTIKLTAVKTDRDGHNDDRVIPTRDSFLGEVQLDCSALVFQPKSFDADSYRKTASFFLNDLLEWYGGRSNEIEFNEVDAFALPILTILNLSTTNPLDVMELVEKYVTHIKRIYEYSEKEQEQAVRGGMSAYLLGQHKTQEQMAAFIASGLDVELTSHQRGSALEGYKRLFEAFTTLYTETLPAKTLIRIISDYIPEIANACPDICEQNVEAFIAKNHTKEEGENTSETTKPEEECEANCNIEKIEILHSNNTKGNVNTEESNSQNASVNEAVDIITEKVEEKTSKEEKTMSIVETVVNYFKKQ